MEGNLENNPVFSMVCNRTKLYSEKRQKIIGENYCYNKSQIVETKDVILRGGLFISTCSIVYRQSIMDLGYPSYCTQCHVGDYPLQIYAAIQGQVYYFNDVMSVYRVENPFSWVGLQKEALLSERRLIGILSEIRMLEGFENDYPMYKKSLRRRINTFLQHNCPVRMIDTNGYDRFITTFDNEIQEMSQKDKFILSLKKTCFYKLYGLYRRLQE